MKPTGNHSDLERELLSGRPQPITRTMKTRRRSCKKQIGPKTAESLRRRLTAYSATAGAALMVIPVADAAIHNITTFSNDGNPFSLTPPDVSGSPANSLQHVSFIGATSGSNHAVGFRGLLSASRFSAPNIQAGLAGISCSLDSILVTANGNRAIKLSFDAPVVGGTNFVNGSLNLAFRSISASGASGATGSFRPNGNNATKTGYLGFRYGASHTYYGWLRVKVINDGSNFPMEVTLADKNGDGIYGAFGLASDNIKAGEIASVPEPSIAGISGLGLLALGAVGVRELRRRQSKAAK